MLKISFLISIVALSGCGAVIPIVQYHTVSTPKDMEGMTDSFFLQRNVITIEKGAESVIKDKDGDNVSVFEFPITSSRVSSNVKLGIKSKSSWYSETMVNLTKIENTDLPSSIGVEVTAKAAETFEKYGGLAVKLIGLTGGLFEVETPKTCTFPIVIPLIFSNNDRATEKFKNDCVVVDVEPVPSEAILLEDLPKDTDTSNYYYSACREAIVTVDFGKTQGVKSKTVRVADPRFLQFTQFPNKGSITMHSECGVSVETKQVSSDNTAPVLGAIADQIKAVKEAFDSANKAAAK